MKKKISLYILLLIALIIISPHICIGLENSTDASMPALTKAADEAFEKIVPAENKNKHEVEVYDVEIEEVRLGVMAYPTYIVVFDVINSGLTIVIEDSYSAFGHELDNLKTFPYRRESSREKLPRYRITVDNEIINASDKGEFIRRELVKWEKIGDVSHENSVIMTQEQSPDPAATIKLKDLSELMDASDTTEIRKLIKDGADVNVSNKTGSTPLIMASYEGFTEIVKLLLGAGADVNKADTYCGTPLFAASWEDRTETVKLLLDAGAVVNVSDEDGITPLDIASSHGNIAIVKLLLDAGADVNVRDKNGNTPLSGESMEGHTEIVKLLLGAGADVNKADPYGCTPLFGASWEDQTETVKLLLDAGAVVNVSNKAGITLLDIASSQGNIAIVKLLMDAGANANVNNRESPEQETPFSKLCEADLFAFGGIGIAAIPSSGEENFRLILRGEDPKEKFISLFKKANPQGKCYALVALKQLDTNTFENLAAEFAQVNSKVRTAHGCSIADEDNTSIVRDIRDGKFSRYLDDNFEINHWSKIFK